MGWLGSNAVSPQSSPPGGRGAPPPPPRKSVMNQKKATTSRSTPIRSQENAEPAADSTKDASYLFVRHQILSSACRSVSWRLCCLRPHRVKSLDRMHQTVECAAIFTPRRHRLGPGPQQRAFPPTSKYSEENLHGQRL